MMKINRVVSRCFTILLLTCVLGCDKPASKPAPASPASPPVSMETGGAKPETVARLHWLGKKRLASETNAVGFMKIWNLPESERLEKQTLDKLATSPWRLLLGQSITNPASALLRPLLDDIVQEESYMEVNQVTNRPGEFVFAIRLSQERAALWETNLAMVLESLTGIESLGSPTRIRTSDLKAQDPHTDAGWVLNKHDIPNHAELNRVGEWTVLALCNQRADGTSNLSMRRIAECVKETGIPFIRPSTSCWIEVDFDLRKLSSVFSSDWNLPTNFPEAAITVVGDGQNVNTRGNMWFPRAIHLELEPWNMPTNLIDGTVISFTALRGIRPWLESCKWWRDLQIGVPPNQIYVWALPGLEMQTYFAVAAPNASNQVAAITDLVLKKGNLWFATHDLARFQRGTTYNGLEWKGLPYLSPFLTTRGEFVFGGLFPAEMVQQPPPISFDQALAHPDLVYYDWESSMLRIEHWIYIGQSVRVIAEKSQIPIESAGLPWLRAIAPHLQPSQTRIILTGPQQLSFFRKGSISLTALELQLLIEWLESPKFPLSTFTMESPRQKLF